MKNADFIFLPVTNEKKEDFRNSSFQNILKIWNENYLSCILGFSDYVELKRNVLIDKLL